MESDRDTIFARVQAALAKLPVRKPLPEIPSDLTLMRHVTGERDWLAVFNERLSLVDGAVVTEGAVLAEMLRAGGWQRGYCDPALLPKFQEFLGDGFQLETTFDRSRVDDYQFGITRGSGGIAETGTIILTDRDTSNRLAALTPWVHIAVIERASIYPHIGAALAALGSDSNIIWATGPSRTADVEGILIQGVHGPGKQIAFVI